MPSYIPRDHPTKKIEELAKREYELKHAIQHHFTTEKLIRTAEIYKKAQLSYLKAELHVIREQEFQGKRYAHTKEDINGKIQEWNTITAEEIINAFK